MAETIHEFPEAAIYGNRFWIVKNGKKKLSNVGLDDNFKSGYIDYIKTYANTLDTPFNCSFVIIKKEDFEKEGGFKPNLKFGEDFDLWVRIALKNKVAYLNNPLSYSNQDVETMNRALGNEKLYDKQHYFVFNLSYLEPFEKSNSDLKYLLDFLRLTCLKRYYLNRKYLTEIRKILSECDFSNHPRLFYRYYHWPIPFIRLFFNLKIIGARLKAKLKFV